MKQFCTKLLSLLLVCLFVCGLGVFASAKTAVAGDINGDGECTVMDVLLILRIVLDDRSNTAADVNGDGKVSLADVIRTLKLTVSTDAPTVGTPESGSASVTVENGTVKEAVSLNGETVSAAVPAGVAVEEGATALTLSVTAMDDVNGNITPGDTETAISYDVHIDGVAENNTVPIVVDLGAILPVGQNAGTVTLYHVENGTAVKMTQVMSLADLDAHNEFYYYPATGTVFVALATFSEIAIVNDTENKWEGEFDYSWYTNATAPLSENDPDYVIANADQLAAFGAIVGGMNGQTQDSFAGKTVKLLANINLGDKESENNPDLIFYPIGYYNSEGTYERTNTAITSGLRNFEGTFDGAGHTVSNFYQNTWEMKGDHDWYSPEEQYYRDGMGLFGKVYGGTVKNLTVDNFSSDGEIATTGVIAAYADCGATFENIAITNCNPRVYNIGNGGIVGCVGWYAKEANKLVTFSNITVDNSNKISALWGSYDVACGGIVGQYYPTSGQSSANYPANAGIHFENCHVAAVMDVYNDVCANYQYYAYRYTGMMIGSIRENETIDGHVYPKMDGITAKGCTVHFGDWNDYYYCELVANSLASYTHDHQMSRLTQVASVDVANKTVTDLKGNTTAIPASGRVNYVVVKAKDTNGMWIHGDGHDYAECYHFVNGVQHLHDVANADNPTPTETVNGAETLKEDKQLVYREFNQLFTGYGWGVTSKGLTDYEGVENMDIKHTENEESVEKFEEKVTELANNTEYKLGDIFSFVDNGVELVPDALTVAVTNLDESNPVSAAIEYDKENWENGTLTLTGTGKIQITIQDYYFCTPTTIEVTVEERVAVEKFETKFTGDFLYRVGNQNTVKLDSLFKAKDGVEIGTVSVTVEALNGTAASGTYTSNATWTNGTIQFSGTGVVKVTITDNDYCTPTELVLEVVDAKNITKAESATANNVVLLKDISGTFTVSQGHTFYGNGFTVTCSGNGSYGSKALSYGFITVSDGGILDNVQIICDIFPESYLYTSEMEADSSGRYPYAYSAVAITGNSTISNSYICGARNNIFIGSGNVTIENTVTECGSLANIQIKSSDASTITLDNVTTIQYQTESPYDTTKTILGFGIVIGDNESASNPTIRLTGDFKQYNWVTDADTSVSNQYAKAAIAAALNVDNYKHTINDTTAVNIGIAYLNTQTASIIDERDNKSSVPYLLNNVTMNISGISITGQVYSISQGEITATSRYDAKTDGVTPYTPTINRVILPTVGFSEEDTALTFTVGYDNNEGRWLSKLVADLDNIDGGSYNFTFSTLDVKKHSISLGFTVQDASGNPVDKNTSITLNQLFTEEYTLLVTDTLLYNASGEASGKEETYTLPFILNATKTSIDPPEFTNAGTATAIRLVETKSGDWRPAYTVLTGVSVTYWSASESKVKTVDLSTLYNSGTISSNVWTYTCDDYTLTITGGAVHSDGSVITPVVANNTLYFASTNKAFGTGTTSRNIILTYVFTDKNASTTWNRTETVTYSELNEYDYNSFKDDGTLEDATDSCLTAGTLITLADGTQKAVEDLIAGDMLLVFNHITGKTEAAPLIFNTHSDNDGDAKEYDVLHLEFANDTEIKVVASHGFFDMTTMQYVYIDYNNYADFIGHDFYYLGENGGEAVTLVNAYIEAEYTRIYCPVTYFHMNSFANGFLDTPNIPGGITGLVNYFEYDADLKYNEELMQQDIETYGLYTYDDFKDYISEEAFNSSPSVHLKVAVGKGMITFEQIIDVIKYLLAGSLIA